MGWDGMGMKDGWMDGIGFGMGMGWIGYRNLGDDEMDGCYDSDCSS